MRAVSLLLLLPLVCGSADEGEVKLGCGFGSGMGITDDDGDGFGATIDCADDDATIHPGADEYCDGVDNNCDGDIDEDEALDAITFYWDSDLDGWGIELGETRRACSQPEGYGPLGDCYDYDPTIRPDADEVCNGLDDDCNGIPDDDPVDGIVGCLDEDHDGYGTSDQCMTRCVLPPGFVELDGDCDDSEAAVNPGAEEVCDGLDNDCNGSVDPQLGDADGDGWDGCGGDCAPDDPAVNPGAAELCGDGIDNDCDGSAGDCGPVGAYSIGEHGLLLAGVASYDAVGEGLAVVGDVNEDGLADLVLGAPYAPDVSSDHGAVYLIHGSGELRSQAELSLADADLVIRGMWPDDLLGWSVAGAGDVDADGLADLIIGAPGDASAGYATGAAYLVMGAAVAGLAGDYPVDELALRISTGAYEDLLGAAVAGAGDVDGDGHDDLLVGAPQADGAAPSSGAAYLLLGPVRGDRDVAQADARWSSNSLDDGFGIALAGVGDLNADGLADMAFGAYRRDVHLTDVGVVAVVMGSADPGGSRSLGDADALFSAAQQRAFAGCAVAGAGDVDGDGHDDLLVGARGQDFGLDDMGVAFLVLGPVGGSSILGVAAVAEIRGDLGYGYAGSAVAGLGDLDGDGHAEIAVGAPYGGEESNGGQVGVFYGPLEGILAMSDGLATLQGGVGDMAGERVAGGGDVDGDGAIDLLIGVPGYDQPSTDAGAGWLLWGGEGL